MIFTAYRWESHIRQTTRDRNKIKMCEVRAWSVKTTCHCYQLQKGIAIFQIVQTVYKGRTVKEAKLSKLCSISNTECIYKIEISNALIRGQNLICWYEPLKDHVKWCLHFPIALQSFMGSVGGGHSILIRARESTSLSFHYPKGKWVMEVFINKKTRL